MMMSRLSLVGAGLWGAMVFGQSGVAPQSPQARKEDTLRRLDAASAKFKSAQADYVDLTYEPPVPDPARDNGRIYFLRQADSTSLGATLNGLPHYDYKNGVVRVYQPQEGCFNAYGGGKDRARIESFLTLGFGGSGKSLAQSWDVQDDGPEKLDLGNGHTASVEKLELVGKEQSVRDQVKQITLWVDPDRAVSLKQVFKFTSGETRTATYMNIDTTSKINLPAYAIPSEASVPSKKGKGMDRITVGPCK